MLMTNSQITAYLCEQLVAVSVIITLPIGCLPSKYLISDLSLWFAFSLLSTEFRLKHQLLPEDIYIQVYTVKYSSEAYLQK